MKRPRRISTSRRCYIPLSDCQQVLLPLSPRRRVHPGRPRERGRPSSQCQPRSLLVLFANAMQRMSQPIATTTQIQHPPKDMPPFQHHSARRRSRRRRTISQSIKKAHRSLLWPSKSQPLLRSAHRARQERRYNLLLSWRMNQIKPPRTTSMLPQPCPLDLVQRVEVLSITGHA